jgi:NitT/TauT family transport system permease protein
MIREGTLETPSARMRIEMLNWLSIRRLAIRISSLPALLPALTFLLFYCLWDLIIRCNIVDPLLLPPPNRVIAGALGWIIDGSIWQHLGASLYRVAIGYMIGIILAIPCGLILGWSTSSHRALSPLLEIGRTISPISWIPLAVIWFGIGDNPAIFIIAITSFFPAFLATLNAYLQLPPIILKTASNFGASGLTLFLRVLIPACLPRIFTGLKISLGIAWMVIVAAEMVGMRSGLGYLILDARNSLRTDLILSAMLIIGVVGLLLDISINRLQRIIVKG